MPAQLNRPRVDEPADLGLVGELGGIAGTVGVDESGSSEVFLRPLALA